MEEEGEREWGNGKERRGRWEMWDERERRREEMKDGSKKKEKEVGDEERERRGREEKGEK